MKYLVCGGAGFIGVNLCRRLLELGHTVTVVDNLYCGNKDNLPQGVEGVEFIEADIRSTTLLVSNINGIFNLACPASPKNYRKDPLYTISICTMGTKMLLEMADYFDIPILHASASDVYGNPTHSQLVEEYRGNVNCTGVRACYEEGKRLAETLCFDHYRLCGTKVRVVRIFNTYGPYMAEDDGVISNFITQALRNDPFTIYGCGKQSRGFCYVDDIVDGLIKAIESDHIGPINLGNPDACDVLSIAKLIKDLTKSSSTTEHSSKYFDDPMHRCPNVNKAKEFLDWKPTTTLEAGLLKTITHFKHNMIQVGIVGGGFVGSATAGFACRDVSVKICDAIPERCKPVGTTIGDLLECDVIFICVPTPMGATGSCDTSIVECCVNTIQNFVDHPPIVVRSTVPPGTCERLGVMFMPEFLREATWREDFRDTPNWYIGQDEKTTDVLVDLIRRAYDSGVITHKNCTVVDSKELELIKYARNSFLATKISFCNEIYDLCEKIGVNWESVRRGLIADPRIGPSHTLVPGPDGERGFGGHCLPKDTNALKRVLDQNKVHSHTISGVLETNREVRSKLV